MISHVTKKPRKSKRQGKKNAQKNSKGGRLKRVHIAATDGSEAATIDAPSGVSEIQGLKYIYRADEYWHSKIGITSDYDVIDFLKQNLPPRVIEMCNKTVFRNFLELPYLRTSKQVIHSLLLRELSQPRTDCIYLEVSGEILHFGVEHFLLISGLKGVAEDGFQPSETGESANFCKKYFGKKHFIRRADIEGLLKNDDDGITMYESDKDCLILALVYFISFYLMGVDSNKCIPAKYFDCVVTGEYAKAAWGDLSFQSTIRGLKKNGIDKKSPGSYRIEGCPLIFQVWFYEVCGACEGFICDRNPVDWTDFRPRMFHWRSFAGDFRKYNLDNMIFNRKATELHVKNVEPTVQEIEILSLQKFFSSSDPQPSNNQNGHIQGKGDELPSASRPQPKTNNAVLNALESMRVQMQQGFHVFNKKIDKTNKRLAVLEIFLKRVTKEGIFKEDECTASEDESEKMNEGGKNALDKEEIGQGNVSVDNENSERSLILYKPFTLSFQIGSDPNFDPVLRSNGDNSEQEQAAIADDENFEVENNEPAGVKAAKGGKREGAAAFTLKRVKDMEGENAVETTDGDIDKMTYKRRKIYIVDSIGCVISINTLL